eukprot:TRINITY_DN407_c0_g1_i1.p1 TRINITY_DN407_c0_g1~~TRINITY_DN407_c0_g1_i1.p1  ORF type:complete len:2038 (+),score=907.90 TRINITY_DN407_c0_g1_i1:163-6276(+)
MAWSNWGQQSYGNQWQQNRPQQVLSGKGGVATKQGLPAATPAGLFLSGPGGQGTAAKGQGKAAVAAVNPANAKTYSVTCRGPEASEVVVRTLIGDFHESGSNHGRKVFKKVVQAAGEAVDVFLYYWDSRDGPAFQGWWFGNKVGGTQVWSHNANDGMHPPPAGWKIPWDGQIRQSVSVTPKADGPGAVSSFPGAAAGGGFDPTVELQSAVVGAKTAIEQAKQLAGNGTDVDAVKAAEEMLVPQVSTLNESLKKLMECQRGATGEVQKRMAQLGAQIRTTQQAVNAELVKVKGAKAKAELQMKHKATEAKDLAEFSQMLPEVQQKANMAEDSVEKAVITSEMIASAGDDMEEAKQAVAETEKAVNEAQKAIGEARVFLNSKLAAIRRFENVMAKTTANTELQKVQQQLTEAQNKLNPWKNVRHDFLQRAAAQKIVGEVLDRLSPAEVEVDRVEEATLLLQSDTDSKELSDQAEKAATKAYDQIQQVMRLIETKKRGVQGKAKDEISKLEERAKANFERLNNLKAKQKEATEKVTCDSVLKEAATKLEAVSSAVNKACDAEGPFLMGLEELPLDQTLTAVKACETAATSANTAVSIARMFMATKLVEAKRYSKAMADAATAKLKELQTQLETHSKRLAELKRKTADRKKGVHLREAEAVVTKAEQLTKDVASAGEVFGNDEELFKLSSDEIKEVASKLDKTEKEANAAVAAGRKYILARQIEAKGQASTGGTDSAAELLKFQTRLSTASSDIGKWKKLCSGYESRLAAKKLLEEVSTRLKTAEEKVEGLGKLLEDVEKEGDAEEKPAAEAGEAKEGEEENKGTDKVKAMETALAEATTAVKGASRYLDLQKRSHPALKDDLESCKPRAEACQAKLDEAAAMWKERAEKYQVAQIIKESTQRVKDAEDNVQKVTAAEEGFKKVEENAETSAEEATQALHKLEEAVSAANSSYAGAKTFLAMKRLATKRLTEAVKEPTIAKLAELQTTLDGVNKILTTTKSGLAERKAGFIKKEVVMVVADLEAKIATSETETSSLKIEDDMTADQMKAACEKAGQAQKQASAALESAKDLLLNRQRDAKGASSSEANTALLVEIGSNLEKVQAAQASLDKHKSALKEQEHKFVASHLVKEATERLEKLEKKLEEVSGVAAPLASDNTDAIAPMLFLIHIVDMLKAHLKKIEKKPADLFKEMGVADGGKLTEAQFVAYVTKVCEMPEQKENDTFFTEEQQKAAFAHTLEGDAKELEEAQLLAKFTARYVVLSQVAMTDSHTVKGGKTVRKMEANEMVEEIELPMKEESIGCMRVKCKAEKDGKEGFISVAGNQGTTYLQPYTAFEVFRKKVEEALADLDTAQTETSKYLDAKAADLKTVRSGPLGATRAELQSMKPKISKVGMSLRELKKKVAAAGKKLGDIMEVEKQKRQEAADKKAAEEALNEIMGSYTKAQTAIEEAITKATEALAADLSEKLKLMAAAEPLLTTAQALGETASTAVKEKLETLKTAAKGPFGELRADLVKKKVTLGQLEGKCKKQSQALQRARKTVGNEAHAAFVTVLKEHATKSELSSEALFKNLAKDAEDIPVDALKTLLNGLPDCSLKAEQLDLALDRYTGVGLSKMGFMDFMQEYQDCVKEIAITTQFEVKSSKTVRKAAIGEIFEVLEGPKTDESSGIPRVQCRAITDGATGWVTLKGNQGTPFLQKGAKPYICHEKACSLHEGFESKSKEVRQTKEGEVFEVLEGPKKEPPMEILRAKGKAKKDGKAGWVSMKDAAGGDVMELTDLLVCKQSIAITTTFDIAEGKAIRKLDAGETLEKMDEEEKKDEKRGLLRIKVKTSKGEEGWITIKGNQGTAYAEKNDRLYICKVEVSLEKSMTSGSTKVKTIEKGEVFEMTDGPKTETIEGPSRMKGKSLLDNTEGWFTMVEKVTMPWETTHACKAATPLHKGAAVEGAEEVRSLAVGEKLSALAPPKKDEASGLLRLRCRADKDGAVGFVSVKDAEGNVLLAPGAPAPMREERSDKAPTRDGPPRPTRPARPSAKGGAAPRPSSGA